MHIQDCAKAQDVWLASTEVINRRMISPHAHWTLRGINDERGTTLSEEKSFLANLVSNPTSFSILVLSAVILIVWLDQRQPHTAAVQANPGVSAPGKTMNGGPSSGLANSIALTAPAFNSGNTPQILNTMGSNEKPDKLPAPDLSGLLAGLEAKVAANPEDTGKRLLLAQTYNELGMVDKALKTLRKLQTEQPDNTSIQLVLAEILSKSSDSKDLKESLQLLDKLAKDKSIKQYLVYLYRGNALIRQQDHKGALESWKASLADMPEGDNRRAMLQQRVGELSQKSDTNNKTKDKKGKS